MIRNISPPDSGARLDNSQWAAEKERLAQRCLGFFRDKGEREQELRHILSRRLKREEGAEDRYFLEKVDFFVNKRKQEITSLLNSEVLSKQSRLKLTAELKFLSLKDLYLKLKDRVLENVLRERRTSRIFERQLLDRSFFMRERTARKEGGSGRREEHTERRRRLKQRDFL